MYSYRTLLLGVDHHPQDVSLASQIALKEEKAVWLVRLQDVGSVTLEIMPFVSIQFSSLLNFSLKGIVTFLGVYSEYGTAV